MSQVIDHIFSEVCLDPRVKDGIFKLEETEHMEALRDCLMRGGLTLEDAISTTNKMLESKFPDRQAYRRKDGMLITWPNASYKKKAFKEHPGEYVEEAEAIRLGLIPNPKATPQAPAPQREPKVHPKSGDDDEKSKIPQEPGPQSVFQGDQELSIEPARGPEKPESPPTPPVSPVVPPISPERKAAEKAIVKQMIQGDEIVGSKFYPSIHELYEKAEKSGLKEAAEFLKQYVNPQ
jgi:hypothetical protein